MGGGSDSLAPALRRGRGEGKGLAMRKGDVGGKEEGRL